MKIWHDGFGFFSTSLGVDGRSPSLEYPFGKLPFFVQFELQILFHIKLLQTKIFLVFPSDKPHILTDGHDAVKRS
jgi:hypothetical protein